MSVEKPSILDLLLETDAEKFQHSNTKDFEITRLSEKIGEKFIVQCSTLTSEKIRHVAEISKNNIDTKTYSILESCRIEGKKINSKELMEKFGAITPPELIEKLLLPGEIQSLYDEISTLSGYARNAVEEIKN